MPRMVAPAILCNGAVYRGELGWTHCDVHEEYLQGVSIHDLTDGFVDAAGKFYSRAEAYALVGIDCSHEIAGHLAQSVA